MINQTPSTLKVVVRQAGSAWGPALIVSIATAAFALVTFWWLNLRRGRLAVSEPTVWAGYSQETRVGLRFPLAFRNSGARLAAVTNLRLSVPALHAS